jgi:hypothetical protein
VARQKSASGKEDRGQRTEDRGQRTEDRGQRRTEDRGQRIEDRGGQMTEDRGQRTEENRGGQMIEDRGGQRRVNGFLSTRPEITIWPKWVDFMRPFCHVIHMISCVKTKSFQEEPTG